MERRTRVLVAPALAPLLALALAGSLTACTGDDGEQPEDAAAVLVGALNRGKLGEARFVPKPGPAPQKRWTGLTEGMGDARAKVTLGEVTESESGETATADLDYTWTLPDRDKTWSHTGSAELVRGDDDLWRVRFGPAVLGLRPGERLDLDTTPAERAGILGAGRAEIVRNRRVYRVGLDKAQVKRSRQAASARAVARVVDVDAGSFLDRVEAAGEKAFVEAIVLREADAAAVLPATESIQGARALEDTLPLAPTREFARPILGSVGPVTAEIIEKSDGGYEIGDEAGLSGLQQRYDTRLRGTPGAVVRAVPTGDDEGEGRKLFSVPAEPGRPLRTTLDVDLQQRAEETLAGVGPASALVAIRPSTGGILAAASGPGSEGYSTATVGRYAPGSTFKVVSSLALLRAGLSPDSTVQCPATVVVDGKEFKNYDDYPASGLGRISLADAVANSCNTAFIGARGKVGSLPRAAAALGLGVDHDLGFPAYFGQVPADPGSETGAAAAMIGQGRVLASPMAMAAVVASVAKGSTVVPHLLADAVPDDPAPEEPLTRAEATTLRSLLRGVVERGSGRSLADLPGPPVIAKTGTAEFGEPLGSGELRTHAWMVAAQGDLAVAAFVEVGDSGSGTAGPLLERFLRAAR